MFNKSIVLGILLGALSVAIPAFALPFTDDFTSSNWQVSNGLSSQFEVLAGGVGQLTTANSPTNFSSPLTLSQVFDYDPSVGSLSFWMQWLPSTGGDAMISADIVDFDNGSMPVVDPFSSILFASAADLLNRTQVTLVLDSFYDFSSTSQLQLTFSIQDFDFSPDQLRIDFDNTAPVPEPSTVALLGIGIAGLALARLRKARS